MDLTRRGMMGMGALAPFLMLAACMQRAAAEGDRFGDTLAESETISETAIRNLGSYPGYNQRGSEKIAMLCYPEMTALDLVGPQYFFACMIGAAVHLVTADPDLKPVPVDTGFTIGPTIHTHDCPEDLDVLFVPGGLTGTVAAMRNDAILDFLVSRAAKARFVTSVCTGSLLLGQAGLLEGKRATSHWATRHLLPEFGATPVDARVVEDGNIVTGAGVSAGLDFALTMLKQMRGEKYAQAIQLLAEYAPEPPLSSGTLDGIEPELGRNLHEMMAVPISEMRRAAPNRRR